MVSLGETAAILKRLRREAAGVVAASATPAGPAPPTPRLVATSDFGANPGGLRMFSHVAVDLAAGAALVVTLHGCGQSAAAYAAGAGWITLADRLGLAVLAPEQSQANNFNRCFNWFAPGDIARGQGEAASIAAMIDCMVRTHRLDPAAVFITGLSAGGAMTAAMLAAYPELFAGGAIFAGTPYAVARGVPGALQLMHKGAGRSAASLGDVVRAAAPTGPSRALRLSIWHGDADTVVNVRNAEDLADQWSSALGLSGAPTRTREAGGLARSLWRGPAGAPVLELNILAGFGHGTPLSTGRADDVGASGAFMLEAGVSSTLETARFWGLGARTAPGGDQGARSRPGVTSVRADGPSVAQKLKGAAAKLWRRLGLSK